MARKKEGSEANETKVPDTEKKSRKNPKKDPRIQAVIDLRRDMVASLVARGMRQTEITKQLGTQIIIRNGKEQPNPSYLVNPESGLPFDKATINRDVAALKAQWRKSAEVDSEEWFARQLAEIDEIKRKMWAKEDVWGVARALELEIKLTGTARPEKKEIKLDDKQFEAMQSAKDRVRGKIAQMMGQAVLSEDENAGNTED